MAPAVAGVPYPACDSGCAELHPICRVMQGAQDARGRSTVQAFPASWLDGRGRLMIKNLTFDQLQTWVTTQLGECGQGPCCGSRQCIAWPPVAGLVSLGSLVPAPTCMESSKRCPSVKTPLIHPPLPRIGSRTPARGARCEGLAAVAMDVSPAAAAGRHQEHDRATGRLQRRVLPKIRGRGIAGWRPGLGQLQRFCRRHAEAGPPADGGAGSIRPSVVWGSEGRMAGSCSEGGP